jgi:hypothetical protein
MKFYSIIRRNRHYRAESYKHHVDERSLTKSYMLYDTVHMMVSYETQCFWESNRKVELCCLRIQPSMVENRIAVTEVEPRRLLQHIG